MPVVQTSEAGMQAAAQEFSARANEFIGHLRSVNGQMAALQSTWSGTASTTFNQAMDAWEMSFQKIIDRLVGMMEVMGVNTQYYAAAEDEASHAAQSFSTALPGL